VPLPKAGDILNDLKATELTRLLEKYPVSIAILVGDLSRLIGKDIPIGNSPVISLMPSDTN
jgi:hypothetical protein